MGGILAVSDRIRHHGLRASVGKAVQRAQTRMRLDETHFWYEYPLGEGRRRTSLEPGLALIRAGESELPLIGGLPTLGQEAARRRLEAGHDLWMVLKEGRPVFACWILHGSVVPVPAVRGGELYLPPDLVCLEDSVSSPSYRGRGTAAAAWSGIADSLEKTPVKSIITKTAEGNTAAERAVLKGGFEKIAVTHYRRTGIQERTAVHTEPGATADWLAEQLLR